MKTAEARSLGADLAVEVEQGNIETAYVKLAPVLAQRTPFAMLRHIGAPLGALPGQHANAFMERVACERTEGGWVVIASMLEKQLAHDFDGVFIRCRGYVMWADIWYATDILGEGVAGPALLLGFDDALQCLNAWRSDENAWVRRTLGVAIHFWAKRTHGDTELSVRVARLLDFLSPMFEERDIDAVKGVGWGLKTLGRYYPGVLTPWLVEQVVRQGRKPRATMLRKALTFLSPEQRAMVTGT